MYLFLTGFNRITPSIWYLLTSTHEINDQTIEILGVIITMCKDGIFSNVMKWEGWKIYVGNNNDALNFCFEKNIEDLKNKRFGNLRYSYQPHLPFDQ